MKKSRVIATAALATIAVVGVPSAAHAQDQFLWSGSGRSYMWYNDAGNQITVCDMVNNDEVGAHGHRSWLGSGSNNRTVYNGCETWSNIPDGVQIYMEASDR